MKNKILRSPFILLFCLSVYYLFAWNDGAWPDLKRTWNTDDVVIRQKGKPDIQLWLWNTTDSAFTLDHFGRFNRMWIGLAGNVLNYYLEVTPEWLTLGTRHPRAWYFWSFDFPSQEESGADMIRRKYRPGAERFPAELRKQGVTVITLAVPVKSAIEREFIPEKWKDRYRYGTEAYREIVLADPDWTVDLYSAFTKYRREHSLEVLYRPLDIHWNSRGMAVAAREIVKLLVHQRWNVRVPEIHQVRELTDGNTRIGNFLLGHLFLAPDFVKSRPELQWTEPIYDIDRPGPSTPGRVVIFGSSFSTPTLDTGGPDFSYGNLLSRALGRELVLHQIAGKDFIDSMRAATEGGFTLQKGDLVIFEFPLWQVELVWEKSRVFPAVQK